VTYKFVRLQFDFVLTFSYLPLPKQAGPSIELMQGPSARGRRRGQRETGELGRGPGHESRAVRSVGMTPTVLSWEEDSKKNAVFSFWVHWAFVALGNHMLLV